MEIKEITRKTTQEIMPPHVRERTQSGKDYNLYPFHSLGGGKISNGYPSLADWMASQKVIKIDGYVGVDWHYIIGRLGPLLEGKGLRVNWVMMENFMHSQEEIEQLVQPYMGEEGSVWGYNADLSLRDFFRPEALTAIQLDQDTDLNIIIGTGAALTAIPEVDQSPKNRPTGIPLVYIDLPKNELLYRMRAGSIGNFGGEPTGDDQTMYKRFYFVDWRVCNQHKESLLKEITVFADSQWTDTISWLFAEDLFAGIKKLSTSVFRPRPWFDPGVWGGQWMKKHFPQLSRDEPNYAWSFEIIAPENGLVFESDGNLLEVSFDTLMFQESKAILGRHEATFGTYFPIRFNFLDTFSGGNLSIQSHPSLSYVQKEFGETFTQDETYYILDSKPDSIVYLGFKDNINPEEFRQTLEDSHEHDQEVDVNRFLQSFNANKHDFFLIPNQTIHSSGSDNLVLEISATPYIYTFKMYDWLQKDSQGKSRPINIEHGFNNLNFERKGERVSQELVSKPEVIEVGGDWQVVHLPTHTEHYYDVHRLEFNTEIEQQTEDGVHILMLVDGTRIEVETQDGTKTQFNYAETFIVPASAKSYRLINKGSVSAKVIKAFVKNKADETI